MSILDKIFKKRKPHDSSDDFKIILRTNKKLSEENKNTIFAIVKNGIESNSDFSNIAINIMMNTEIYEPIIINRIKNGVEVIF